MTKHITLLIAVVSLAACGDSGNNTTNQDNQNNEMVTPGGDACEHMVDGPAEALTAVAAGETAPSISEPHTRYDITIPDGDGVLLFEIGEDTEMHFFFDADVTLTVTDANDADVAAEETIDAVDECAEVAEGAAYDLGVGTYNLRIETSEATVSMVPIPAGDHDHDHEG